MSARGVAIKQRAAKRRFSVNAYKTKTFENSLNLLERSFIIYDVARSDRTFVSRVFVNARDLALESA